MKKIIIASIMAVAASAALAGSATIEYQSAAGRQGNPGNTALVLTVRENVTPSIVVDVGFTNTETAVSQAVSTSVEVGATYSLPVSVVTLSTRVALGQNIATGASDSYWSIEPGVAYAINDKLSVGTSFQYSAAMSNTVPATVRTSRVGAAYAITAKDSVGVRYDVVRGDAQFNVVALNYTRSF